jgi:hypothetical protein
MSAEPTVGNMMAAYAQDAVEYALTFDITLDFTPESIRLVEQILSVMYDERPRGWIARWLRRGPSDALVEQVSKMLGGYVGEVMRRAWGGEWEFADLPGMTGVLALRTGEHTVFPPLKVFKRLTNGPEDDVWRYFQVLQAQRAPDAPREDRGR